MICTYIYSNPLFSKDGLVWVFPDFMCICFNAVKSLYPVVKLYLFCFLKRTSTCVEGRPRPLLQTESVWQIPEFCPMSRYSNLHQHLVCLSLVQLFDCSDQTSDLWLAFYLNLKSINHNKSWILTLPQSIKSSAIKKIFNIGRLATLQ